MMSGIDAPHSWRETSRTKFLDCSGDRARLQQIELRPVFRQLPLGVQEGGPVELSTCTVSSWGTGPSMWTTVCPAPGKAPRVKGRTSTVTLSRSDTSSKYSNWARATSAPPNCIRSAASWMTATYGTALSPVTTC